MKKSLLVFIFSILIAKSNSYGQQSSFLIGIDHIQKTDRLFHYLLSDQSFGLKIGYSRSFANEAWAIDLLGFANYIDYNFDIGKDRYFNGGTLYTGLGLKPRYYVNPDQKLRLSAGLTVKEQYSWGQGNVFQRLPEQEKDQLLEKKFVKAGFGFGIAPTLMLEYPIRLGFVSVETGWDSSNAGTGINLLRSQYYKTINYNSRYIYIGFGLKVSM